MQSTKEHLHVTIDSAILLGFRLGLTRKYGNDRGKLSEIVEELIKQWNEENEQD